MFTGNVSEHHRAATVFTTQFLQCTPSATGSYGRQAGWLADEIQVAKFRKFQKLAVG